MQVGRRGGRRLHRRVGSFGSVPAQEADVKGARIDIFQPDGCAALENGWANYQVSRISFPEEGGCDGGSRLGFASSSGNAVHSAGDRDHTARTGQIVHGLPFRLEKSGRDNAISATSAAGPTAIPVGRGSQSSYPPTLSVIAALAFAGTAAEGVEVQTAPARDAL